MIELWKESSYKDMSLTEESQKNKVINFAVPEILTTEKPTS